MAETGTHKYSTTIIELSRQPQIYVNYAMDQNVNTVDPNAYTVPANQSHAVPKEDEFLLTAPETESGPRPGKSKSRLMTDP